MPLSCQWTNQYLDTKINSQQFIDASANNSKTSQNRGSNNGVHEIMDATNIKSKKAPWAFVLLSMMVCLCFSVPKSIRTHYKSSKKVEGKSSLPYPALVWATQTT